MKPSIAKFLIFGIILAFEAGVGGATLGIINAVEGSSNPAIEENPEQEEETPDIPIIEVPDDGDDVELFPIHTSLVKNKFECEQMTIIGQASVGDQRGAQDTNNPSGGSFVGELNGNIGFGVSFKFVSDLDTVARFKVCIGERKDKQIDFKTSFMLVHNEHEQSILSTVTAKCDASVSYFGWKEYTVAYLNIKRGTNAITFVTKGTFSSNLDYFAIETNATLSEAKGA